jgi:hypothetical protein
VCINFLPGSFQAFDNFQDDMYLPPASGYNGVPTSSTNAANAYKAIANMAAASGNNPAGGGAAARSTAASSTPLFSAPWDPLAFPPHVLPSTALFLHLQGYSEFFLKSKAKARNLLRLGLGVTEDGDGGEKSE